MNVIKVFAAIRMEMKQRIGALQTEQFFTTTAIKYMQQVTMVDGITAPLCAMTIAINASFHFSIMATNLMTVPDTVTIPLNTTMHGAQP